MGGSDRSLLIPAAGTGPNALDEGSGWPYSSLGPAKPPRPPRGPPGPSLDRGGRLFWSPAWYGAPKSGRPPGMLRFEGCRVFSGIRSSSGIFFSYEVKFGPFSDGATAVDESGGGESALRPIGAGVWLA